MRVSDLRKPIPNSVKYEILARQAKCFLCGEHLEGDIVWTHVAAVHRLCLWVGPVLRGLTQREKIRILLQQIRCAVCNGSMVGVHYDHRPALEQRKLNRAKTDFIPPQHDPLFIDVVDPACHQSRTTGRKPGAAKTVTTVGSDAHIAAKVRRMTKPPKKAKRKIAARAGKIRSRGFR